MLELLRSPVIIAGRIPAMANIGGTWRVARIPLDKIKSPSTRQKKLAYDYAMTWRDGAVALLLASARARALPGQAVFVHAVLEFKPAKGASNPADLKQDIDNPSKALLDAIQKAGIIANDKQVICLLLEKVCAEGTTRAVVRSITAGHLRDKRRWLQGLALEGV